MNFSLFTGFNAIQLNDYTYPSRNTVPVSPPSFDLGIDDFGYYHQPSLYEQHVPSAYELHVPSTYELPVPSTYSMPCTYEVPSSYDAFDSQFANPPTNVGEEMCFLPSLRTAPKFDSPVCEEEVVSRDYSEYFTTEQVFASKEIGHLWALNVAKQHKFMISIGRSVPSKPGQSGKIQIICEKGGSHRPKGVGVRSNTKSKKTGCKFQLKLMENRVEENWRLVVVCGLHNHPIGDSLVGNAFAGRPTPDQKKKVREMVLSHCSPNQIYTEINKDPGSCTKKNQVYNLVRHIREEEMEGRTVVQEFFHQCKESNYFMEYRPSATNPSIIGDLFFASPESMKLLKAFPYVLLMDSTYSTNR